MQNITNQITQNPLTAIVVVFLALCAVKFAWTLTKKLILAAILVGGFLALTGNLPFLNIDNLKENKHIKEATKTYEKIKGDLSKIDMQDLKNIGIEEFKKQTEQILKGK